MTHQIHPARTLEKMTMTKEAVDRRNGSPRTIRRALQAGVLPDGDSRAGALKLGVVAAGSEDGIAVVETDRENVEGRSAVQELLYGPCPAVLSSHWR